LDDILVLMLLAGVAIAAAAVVVAASSWTGHIHAAPRHKVAANSTSFWQVDVVGLLLL
jgi:hypothetical protein